MKKLAQSDRKLIIELSIMLVIKLGVLYLIWHLYFSNPVEITSPEKLADVMLDSQGEQP